MPSSRGSAVAEAFPEPSVLTSTLSPVTRVTVTGLSASAVAAAVPVSGLFVPASPCGAATDGAITVTARTAAVAAPSAVRDIGRIALPK